MATQVFIHDSIIAFTSTLPSATLSAEEPLILKTFELLRNMMVTLPFVSFFYVQNATFSSALFQFFLADGRIYSGQHVFASLGDLNPQQVSGDNDFSGPKFSQDELNNFINRSLQFCINLRAQFGAISVVAVTPQYEILQPPVIVAPQVDVAMVGVLFLYQIVTLGMFATPASWSAVGLPASLTLEAATGIITGTPIQQDIGVHFATLSATNSMGTSSISLTIQVNPNSQSAAPVILSPITAAGSKNTAFSYQIVAMNSPTSFGATGLPASRNLTVNAATGLISGTPKPGDAGTYNVPLSATNSHGTGTLPLTLVLS